MDNEYDILRAYRARLWLELEERGFSALEGIPMATATTTKVEPRRAAGGAPPKHNWDAFWIQVSIWTEQWGFGEDDRPRLQKHLEAWTAERFCNPPDPSTIRKKLAQLYQAAQAQK